MPASSLLSLADRRGTKIGAHRGGFWSLAQGTRGDFASSMASGADILELDLRSTSDGGVVVYHDDTLSKHTLCLGNVSDRTFEDVTRCRLLPTGARIESFERILRWARAQDVVLDAEFKDDDVIMPALALVARYDAWTQVYFQANGHLDRYQRARALAPRADILVNASDMNTLRHEAALDDPHLVIDLRKSVQTPEAVALVHHSGKLASANSWRPSGYQELFTAGCDRLFAMGIDIVITNNVASCVAERAARLPTVPRRAASRRLSTTGRADGLVTVARRVGVNRQVRAPAMGSCGMTPFR